LSERPQLWILVGGNGAGKSTYHRLSLEPLGLPFVNADLLARIVFAEAPEAHSYEAAQLAERQRYQLLEQGVSFCFETVYSHHSKVDFIAHAKALGYQVIMVLIHLESTDLNQARIAGRVSEGGHNVPVDKVISRIPRLLDQVRASIPLVDVLRTYDNSSADDPFAPVFTITNGSLRLHREPLPAWAAALLAGTQAT
jgi:predicted ABC-type ATPase